ncbi:MAG: aminotransferase class III-fold pyridoxal phosphate-dependent enzyme, partial [Chloroflexota bacterium]|nr:aminotransferase class III-fold pyridoxal phosphate-dependent enzyme [Chloroflexota bacterium]
GKWYLDGLSGVFVASLGYGNERIVEATVRQLRELHFAPPLHGTNAPSLALAERLRLIAPVGMRGPQGEGGVGVKLLSGGSEATEAAMKLARQYWKQAGHPRKYKIISRYGAYHGATMGALSAGGGWERKSVFEPLVAGFLHHHPPFCFHCPFDQNYGSCGITCAKLVRRTIEAEDPETVAAVIVEPISISSAGFVVPPVEYLQILRQACSDHHVLLIFDEIITGFGRLGQWFGADYYGVTPDLIACGKGMSGGYAPLAAVLIANHVWDAFLTDEPDARREFHHGHTFGGNPVAAAAGVAAIDEIHARDLVANAHIQGAYVRAALDRLAADFPALIADVRGAGLLQGFEFAAGLQNNDHLGNGVDLHANGASDSAKLSSLPESLPVSIAQKPKPGKRFEALARDRGLIARCGNDYVAFAPPLIITRDELDEILTITRACLTDMSNMSE